MVVVAGRWGTDIEVDGDVNVIISLAVLSTAVGGGSLTWSVKLDGIGHAGNE